MDNKIEVKQIKIDDFNDVFINDLSTVFPETEEYPKWNISKTKEFINNPNNILLIGYLNGEMSSFLYGNILDKLDNQKQFIIYEAATTLKHRRKGVMKNIINYLKTFLVENGFDEAWVLTTKSNIPAMNLYSTTGGVMENKDDCMFVYRLK